MKYQWIKKLAWMAAGMVLSSAAWAAWPERTITLVVPYTPGTGIDLVARQLAQMGVELVTGDIEALRARAQL